MIFQNINRRSLVRSAGMTLGFGALPKMARGATLAADPHFFMEIIFRPGWDPSYLCDARPRAMTTAGKKHNYLPDDPTELVGANGGKALVTSLFQPLKAFFDAGQLTIVNGVHMASTFDGHEQNLNYLFTGSPFGGQSLVPNFVTPANRAPVDALHVGQLFGTVLDNVGNCMSITPPAAKNLTKAARAAGPVDLQSPALRYLRDRLAANSGGDGRFSAGAKQMDAGITASPDLADRIRAVELDGPDDDASMSAIMKLAAEYFRRGLTRNAVIEVVDYDLDTHDADSAKQQPAMYPKLVADIVTALSYLRDTKLAVGSETSLLDVTTVVVTSEFGRTMRQDGVDDINNTGTDHNPLSNSVLLAGKSIRGGQIIGASDQETLEAPVSPAHLTLDENLVKMMGKPFDFNASAPTAALLATFDPYDYLTFASIANALLKLFGADDSKLWNLKRDGAPATPLGTSVISPS